MDLLKYKKEKKQKNPKFVRQDHHKKKRLDKIWRKPRGGDSKKRLRKQNRVIVAPGYGTPRELRDKDPSGQTIIRVDSLKDLDKVNAKHTVIVSSKLGFKKKVQILKELMKNKVKILNFPNPEDYIKNKQKQLQSRKKVKVKKEEKPEQEKKSIEDKLSEEDKKKIEKQEIDRLLTKKF